jgi:hypothetical protein
MFLFTNRTSSAPQPAAADTVPHAAPMRKAAQATGVSFDYLAKTAERESRFNPAAKASTSSATGMFQFLDQTWLGMVKQEGPKLGLTSEASAISGDNGRFSVADSAMRQKILALREDPGVSSMMAGALAAKNGQQLEQTLGRKPKEGELYIAHFLGASGAKDLIGLAQTNPKAKAAGSFKDAATSNRNVFFDRTGRAKSAGEVYANLTGAFGQTPVAVTPPQETAATTDKAYQMFRVKGEGKPMHGLFRSDGEQVADVVTNTWSKMARQGRGELAGTETRVAFYPRESRIAGFTASDASPQIAVQGARRSVTVPLPEARPTTATTTGTPSPATATQADAMAAVKRARPNAANIGKPLDLMRFVKAGSNP